MRTPAFSNLCILVAIACAGCGSGGESSLQPESLSADTTLTWPATQRTDRGNFSVTLLPSDGAIERNKHFSLVVTVEVQASSENVPAAVPLKVVVDADMPAHRHGMNTMPEITNLSANRYRVDGMLFHMAGNWVISVDITRQTGSERASFPVYVE